MKKLLALLLALLMALSCVACAAEEAPEKAPAEEKVETPADEAFDSSLILSRPEDADEALAWAKEQNWGQTYTIGFGSLNDSDPVAKVMGDRFVEWCGYYGIEVVRTDNKSEGTTAVTNVQLMLNQGVDAIVEFNVDASVSGAVMDMCNEAGVPVVAIDIPHEGATFFGADNYLCGEMCGEYIVQAALDKWGDFDCLLLMDQIVAGELPRQRVLQAVTGARKILPDLPDEKVYNIDGGVSLDTAVTASTAFLQAHPDEKIAVVCLSAAMPVAMMSAAETAGRSDDVIIIGNNEDAFFGYNPEGSPWVAAITFELVNYGKWIAPLVREGLDTGVWPENVYVEHHILTHENMDELFPNWREDMEAGIYPK